MQLKDIFENIKLFIIEQYNKLINCIKNLGSEKPKINNQTVDQDVHVVKAKVKRVRVNKMKTNL